MCNPKHRILTLLKKNLVISKVELYSRIKSTNTSTIVNWLLENKYIKPGKINPDKLSLTSKGEKYHRKITMQLYAKIAVVLTLVAIIVPALSKKDFPPGDHISIYQTTLDSTFYIKNSQKFNDLAKIIETKSSYTYDLSSNNTIEITYSGEILELRKNYYFYPGGCLIIKYGGDVVRKFDSMKIDKTTQDGSLIFVLTAELDRRVINTLNNNKEMITDEIISILNIR